MYLRIEAMLTFVRRCRSNQFSFTFALLLGVSANAVADEPAQHYVTGSYINVREEPSTKAKVISHLVANTPVTLMSSADGWCDIGWGDDQHGFAACNLLGQQASTLEQVSMEYLGNKNKSKNPNYSPQRAFWIEPTVQRLFDAGLQFQKTHLSGNQAKQEDDYVNYVDRGTDESPQIKRFKIEEFEAMKLLLMNGMVSPASQYLPPTPWEDIQAIIKKPINQISKKEQNKLFHGLYFDNTKSYVDLYNGIRLPSVKSSFFSSLLDIGRPGAGTEEISTQYQIPLKMRILGKPYWGGDNNSYPLLVGAWDIGEVETVLTTPIYEVAGAINGKISIGTTRISKKNSFGDSNQYCVDSFRTGTVDNLLPGFKVIERPIFSFLYKTLPSIKQAKITITKPGKRTQSKKLATNESLSLIDLNGDQVPDLSVWDDGGNGIFDSLEYVQKRILFANVNGKWFLLDTDITQACGC